MTEAAISNDKFSNDKYTNQEKKKKGILKCQDSKTVGTTFYLLYIFLVALVKLLIFFLISHFYIFIQVSEEVCPV